MTRLPAPLLALPLLLLSAAAAVAQNPEEATAPTVPAPAAPAAPASQEVGEPAALDVEAAGRATRLQGMAYLDRRRRVVGASVLVVPEGKPDRAYLTSTDGKGQFRLDAIPDGEYRVEIRRDGFRPVTKNNVSLRFPFRAVVEVPMEEGATAPANRQVPASVGSGGGAAISGRVLDPSGLPMSEVPVRLVRGDALSDPRTVQSDRDGRFEVPDLRPGAWQVSVLGLGYLPLRVELDLGGKVELVSVLIPQPADYRPSPIDLLPPERLIPPAVLSRPPAELAPAPASPPAGEEATSADSTGV